MQDESSAENVTGKNDAMLCFGTVDYIPYCSGVDCPEWVTCHGDKLTGDFSSWGRGRR